MLSSAKFSDGVPREGVADAPVERIGLVLVEAQNVGRRLDARQLATEAGDAGADEHRCQPRPIDPMEAPVKEAESERPGRQKKHPNPNGPMS